MAFYPSGIKEQTLHLYRQYNEIRVIQSIENRIYEVRGERVMLDKDLAALYEVPTKSLNLSVKRNIERFPVDFMFQLKKEEFDLLKLQVGNIETEDDSLRFQIETSKRGGTRYLPYAFTELGVAMLSSILHSARAISMNIAIMRVFVETRRAVISPGQLKLPEEVNKIYQRLEEHDVQLGRIYDALENLLDETIAKRKWDMRERIGFKKG